MGSPPDLRFEGTNRALGISDDMHHGLGSNFEIELQDSILINLILAWSEPIRIADDVGYPWRDRVVEVGMLRRGEYSF